MGNLTGESWHRTYPFLKMDLSGLISNSQLVRKQAIKRERSEQPIGASQVFSIFLCLSSLFSYVSYVSVFLCFLLFLIVVVYYARLRPFYTACRDKIYHFTPQPLLACCRYPSQTAH